MTGQWAALLTVGSRSGRRQRGAELQVRGAEVGCDPLPWSPKLATSSSWCFGVAQETNAVSGGANGSWERRHSLRNPACAERRVTALKRETLYARCQWDDARVANKKRRSGSNGCTLHRGPPHCEPLQLGTTHHQLGTTSVKAAACAPSLSRFSAIARQWL